MRTRCSLILVLVAYLFLDFSEPFMPGVWSFDPGQSMDGVTNAHPGAPRPVLTPGPQRARQAPAAYVKQERDGGPRVTVWIPLVREADASSVDPAPLAEDH